MHIERGYCNFDAMVNDVTTRPSPAESHTTQENEIKIK